MKKDKNGRRQNGKAVKWDGHDKHDAAIALWVLDSKVNVFWTNVWRLGGSRN